MFFDFIYSWRVWGADWAWGMTDRVSAIRPIDEARRLLASITSPPATVAIVKRALALLEEHELGRPTGFSRPARRGAVPVVYTVQTSEMGESLAEHRPDGSSRPFRCPRPLYEALVTVLSDAKRPISTDEIASEIERLVGYRPGEHQYRVPLRLFLAVRPPLLTRSRARYSVPGNEEFRSEAGKLWDSLKSSL
jgi:hypothetical protein